LLAKLAKVAATVAICSLVLSGCGPSKASDSQTSSGSVAADKKFIIVTSFYPIYVDTINVTRGVPGVQVVNMTKPDTGCLHDYQLTPEDLKTLEKADVFVINGAGMEAFLDKVISQQPQLKIVDASKGIELLTDKNGVENPHVWVSISDALLQVNNIAEQLSAIDSAHAAMYHSNAAKYEQKLTALKEKMHNSLDGVKDRDIITFHEAFPYFAKEFNLNIVAVIEREPGAEPSPEELAVTIKTVKEANVKALFAEPQYPAKAAQAIARETGAKVYPLDPAVTGDTDGGAYDSYLNVMERNLQTLLEALK